MQGESRYYDAPGHSRVRPPRTFPVPNVPGPSRGGYSVSHYRDDPQGPTHPAYGDTSPPAPGTYWPQPGIPLGYGAPSQALQQPYLGHDSRSEYVPLYSVQSTNEPYSPHPLGFVRPQNPGRVAAAPSPGSAGVQNVLGQSHSHQLANEPYSHNHLGSVHLQNPGPWTAAPSQGFAGGQNPFGGPYSQVIGLAMVPKKKALSIGTNYSWHQNPGFRLRRCTKDARDVAEFLRANLDFARDDIRIMTDDANDRRDLPTKNNILEAMWELVHGARPGDSFFFYFSGHGVQIKDTNGDEFDGLDECICAMDYRGGGPYENANTPGLIVDDDMHRILVKRLPRGCRLFAMFDSCHSGTALDLPYIYNSIGVVKPINHPNIPWLLDEKASDADVISLSASKDHQTALETPLGGALRRAFMECVGAFGGRPTYRGLLRGVREYMTRHHFPQRPQLSSSHEIDTDTRFIA